MTLPTPHEPHALQRITDAALSYLSLDDLLAELLQRTTEALGADTAAILLLDEDADALIARATKGIEEQAERRVRVPLGKGFAGRIAAERRPVVIEDTGDADIFNPVLIASGVRSLLGVPLLVRGQVIGVLHVGTLAPREFTEADAELLQLAGDRAAIAIDNARAYERERDAVLQLRALQRVTDAALAYLSLDELLAELLERATEILSTDTAAFLLLDDLSGELVARAAKGIEEEVEQGVRIPLGKGFAGRIAATREAVVIPDTAHADIYNPILRQKGIRSLLGVPLLVEGRVIGVLHVGTLVPRLFTRADLELLQLAGDRAAIAIERAQLYHQRGVIEALQRSLLPEQLPSYPGLTLAARYQAAAVRGGIGGDWYDVFALPRGGAALIVGDVMGHGIAAAALMAQIRTGLRAYALDGHSPAGVLERLNQLAVTLAPRQMITLGYAAVDLAREKLVVASAGHIPPLLRRPGGETELLPVEGDPPLSTSSDTRYREHEFDFAPGSTLVLLTDGAVEVRGESLDITLERARTLVAGESDPQAVCVELAGGAVRGAPATDDVAVLVARSEPLSEQLRTTWPADAAALGEMRHLLRRWLAHWGADSDETYDIMVAVQEASANAIEHAYAPGRASFEMDATYDDGLITFAVRDRGRWRPPRGVNRGRGLPLMEALMDDVEIVSDDAGTAVVLRRRLGRLAA